MNAETLFLLSWIAFIAAGVFLIIAAVIWFVFQIRRTMGELSGKLARKSVQLLREENRKTGYRFYGSSRTNLERGKLTKPILTQTAGFETAETEALAAETQLLREEAAAETQLLETIPQTEYMILDDIVVVHTTETI